MKPDSPRARHLALAAALLGWLFDGLEMGLFPLVGKPALQELLACGPKDPQIGKWFGVITAGFLVGAATGGVLFGWLGDRVGRVRAMTLSVLVYAGASGLCAAAQTPWHLALLRFVGALGMGGEWALGVALVMELWPDAGRARMAGWIGAFGNLGYCVVGGIALGLNRFGDTLAGRLESVGLPVETAAALTRNNNWRLLMLAGALPAVLTLFIRAFVPESAKWTRERSIGKTSHWSAADLLAVVGGAVLGAGVIALWADDWAWGLRVPGTLLGVAGVAACYLLPVRNYLGRAGAGRPASRFVLKRMLLAAGLSGVPLLATWAGVMWVYPWVDTLTAGKDPDARPLTQVVTAFAAAAGSLVGAVVCVRFGRRRVYAVLCVLSLVTLVGFFRLNTAFGWEFLASAGLVGFVTAAFYGWLPLYLPELFPTAVRAYGQGFGFNFGRVLAAVGALQTGALLAAFDNDYAKACSVTAGVYLVGLALIAVAPETRGKPLPE